MTTTRPLALNRSSTLLAVGISIFLFSSASPADDCYRFVQRWGQTGPGALQQPINVAVDSAGYAYVTEGPGGGKSLKKFRADGSEFLWKSDMTPISMAYPQGVTVDTSGYVYVTDFPNGRICVFSQDDGEPVGWFGGCTDPSHSGSGHWHARESTPGPARTFR